MGQLTLPNLCYIVLLKCIFGALRSFGVELMLLLYIYLLHDHGINTYYPTAIKIVLARLWDNTFICVITKWYPTPDQFFLKKNSP